MEIQRGASLKSLRKVGSGSGGWKYGQQQKNSNGIKGGGWDQLGSLWGKEVLRVRGDVYR